jgi:hypothetical protein
MDGQIAAEGRISYTLESATRSSFRVSNTRNNVVHRPLTPVVLNGDI